METKIIHCLCNLRTHTHRPSLKDAVLPQRSDAGGDFTHHMNVEHITVKTHRNICDIIWKKYIWQDLIHAFLCRILNRMNVYYQWKLDIELPNQTDIKTASQMHLAPQIAVHCWQYAPDVVSDMPQMRISKTASRWRCHWNFWILLRMFWLNHSCVLRQFKNCC